MCVCALLRVWMYVCLYVCVCVFWGVLCVCEVLSPVLWRVFHDNVWMSCLLQARCMTAVWVPWTLGVGFISPAAAAAEFA